MAENRMLRCLTTGFGHRSPASLTPVGASWNRHQPVSKVSVLADIQGGDEVAEE
jgi:hypothetical protein